MNNTLLAYAFNEDKKLVHIDTVKNGLDCNCTCPGCNEPLVAKNDGKIREHHFAHLSGNDCGTGYMTIRHIWAEEILFENRTLPIAVDGKKGYLKTERMGREVTLTELNIIPDIFGRAVLSFNYLGLQLPGDIPFIVEIYVTHKVDENKAAIIKRAGIPAVEIDLSKSTATTKEDLIKDISNQENWNVINDKIGGRFLPRINLPYIPIGGGYGGRPSTPPIRTYHRSYYRRKR